MVRTALGLGLLLWTAVKFAQASAQFPDGDAHAAAPVTSAAAASVASAPLPAPAATAAPATTTPSRSATPTPEAKPQASPPLNWNVGASVFSSSDALFLASPPNYAALLERRVSSRTWLLLNASAAYESRQQLLSPIGDEPLTRSTIDVRTLTTQVRLGLRQAIVQSVVEVSLFAAIIAGRQSIDRDDLRANETVTTLSSNTLPGRAYALGVSGGAAVERKLVDALAVRISVNLVSATFSRIQSLTLDSSGVGVPGTQDTRRLSLSPQPALELHLYF